MSRIPTVIIAALPVLGMLLTSIPNIHRILDNLENSRQTSFFTRHDKIISWIGNICLLLWVGYFFYLEMRMPTQELTKFISEKRHSDISLIWWTISSFLVKMIGFTGIAGSLVGFLSVFQCNITKAKRVLLLCICLLPITLTLLDLLIRANFIKSTIDPWMVIKLGLMSFFLFFMINGTTIVLGKHIMTLCAIGLYKIVKHFIKPPIITLKIL